MGIEFVSIVYETDQQEVLSLREDRDFASGNREANALKNCCGRESVNIGVSSFGYLCFELIVHLERLINVLLPIPLNGRIIFTGVENLEVVGGIYPHPVSELIGLIERLTDTSPVIEEESSLVHELHGTLCQRGTSLRSGVHQSQLIAIGDIFDG